MEGGTTYAKKTLRQPLFEKSSKKFSEPRGADVHPPKRAAQNTPSILNVNPFLKKNKIPQITG